MINRMKSIDSTGEYYLSITKKIVNAKAFSSLEKFLMNDAVGIVMEKVDWAIKYLIAFESEENDFQLPKEQKKIDELEADIQNLISDTPKDDHLKFYKDFKIIYKKLNDFNYWINKEITAQPFIKKLDDVVNVINTIYQQNYHFLWFDQTKLTNLRQILIKNINHVLNIKKH